jgi:hypothetical protein
VRRPLIDALNALVGGDDLIAVMTPEMSARELRSREGRKHRADARALLGKETGRHRCVETRYEMCYAPPIIDGPAIAKAMIDRRREVRVLDALEDLIHSLRVLREERKAVITISDGWPLYGPDPSLTKPLLTPTQDPKDPGDVYIPIPGVGKDPITGRPTTRPPSESFSTDGGGPADRATCEVHRSALAGLTNEHRFTSLMQAANRANVSFYPIGPGSFSASYAFESRRNRSLQQMADMTAAMPSGCPVRSKPVCAASSGSSLLSRRLLLRRKIRRPFHRIDVRVKRPGVQCARVPATWLQPPRKRSGARRCRLAGRRRDAARDACRQRALR